MTPSLKVPFSLLEILASLHMVPQLTLDSQYSHSVQFFHVESGLALHDQSNVVDISPCNFQIEVKTSQGLLQIIGQPRALVMQGKFPVTEPQPQPCMQVVLEYRQLAVG